MVTNIIVVVLIAVMLVALFLRKKKLSGLDDVHEEKVVKEKLKPIKENRKKANEKSQNESLVKANDQKLNSPKKAEKQVKKVKDAPVENYKTFILADDKTVMIDDEDKSLGGISLKLVNNIDNTIAFSGVINKNITFGRSEHNDVIIEDKSVSKVHALVSIIDGDLWINDNQSTNGTKVNGVKISSDTIISDGDIIKIGRIELRTEIS